LASKRNINEPLGSIKCREFLTSCTTVSLSGRTLLHCDGERKLSKPHFTALFQHVPGGAEKNFEHLSEYPAFGLRFEDQRPPEFGVELITILQRRLVCSVQKAFLIEL
jgi:hypothetical protein